MFRRSTAFTYAKDARPRPIRLFTAMTTFARLGLLALLDAGT